MILKYNDFILDRLLLESDVIYSDRFKRVLDKMGENKFAKDLLEIENKDLNTNANFIDIKKDNDSVLTFTPDRIAQEILKSEKEVVIYQGGHGGRLTNNITSNADIFDKLGYVPKEARAYEPKAGEIGEVISKNQSDKTGKVWCYVKFQEGEGVYNQEKLKPGQEELKKIVFNKNRQDIRIGRLIRSLLNLNGITGFSNSDIENLLMILKAP